MPLCNPSKLPSVEAKAFGMLPHRAGFQPKARRTLFTFDEEEEEEEEYSMVESLPCLLSLHYVTPGSLPSFCMNVLHTGLGY